MDRKNIQIMRVLFLLFVGGCLNLHVSAQNTDSLRHTMLQRPNDILHSVTGWNSTSTDGFTYQLDSGLYGFGGPQPTILLDGIPLEISYFGWQNLNMVPLLMRQVDDVDSGFRGTFPGNSIAKSGFVNIQTSKLERGLNVGGSVFLGNEAGDPGPWIYDPQKVTPNVDRWGPDYSGQVGYSSHHWNVRGLITLREHQPTDLMNHRRVEYELNTTRDTDREPYKAIITSVLSGLGEISYESELWEVKGRLVGIENDDFIFLHPYSRELPAILKYRQVVFQTVYQPSEWSWLFRYTNDDKQLDHRAYRSDYHLDWQEQYHMFRLAGQWTTEKATWDVGLKFRSIQAMDSLTKIKLGSVYNLFSSLSYKLSGNNRLKVKADVDLMDNDLAPSTLLEVSSTVNNGWTLENRLFYTEMLPFQRNSIGYWANQGLSLLDQLGVPDQVSRLKNSQLLQYKMVNRLRVSNSVNLNLAGSITRHYALDIPWVEVTYRERVHAVTERYTQRAEQGTRSSINVGIEHRPDADFTQTLTAQLNYSLAGSDRYYSYWEQIPRQKLVYSFSIHPVPDLHFKLRTIWRGATRWNEYEELDGRQYQSTKPQYQLQTDRFQTQTPSYLNVELSARKWFWDDKLTTTFSIRNLLNQEIRMHTMGAELSLLFYIKATLRL